jgi:hypothetical protein
VDVLLSTYAFKFNLRRYMMDMMLEREVIRNQTLLLLISLTKVGWCSFTPGAYTRSR